MELLLEFEKIPVGLRPAGWIVVNIQLDPAHRIPMQW
jgi:hypothetical protein